MNKKKISLVGFMSFLILAIVIGLSKPFQPELSSQGHFILMMLLITIGLWIFKPRDIPFSISSGLFMASLLILDVPANIVFAGFSGTAVWTLIAALFFGFVLAKTGLGKRIAYFGIKNTHLSYAGLLTMWAIIGVVLSILTPSITVRIVIVTPIALNCVNICKLSKGSKGRSLVLLTAWAMALIPGTGWLTGSLTGPILSGFFASVPGLGAIEFSDWARVSLLPMSIISVLTVIGGYIVLKPSEPLSLSRDVFIEEYKKLGSISKDEKITGAILIATFIMFVSNSWHGIPDAATCLIAWFLLSLAGIIKGKEVSTGINWDLVIFVGAGMGFGAIFEYAGISKWMSLILVDALKPISASPWLFVYIVLILMFIWRFVDIAVFVPTQAIVVAILPQVSQAYGINPLVWVPLLCIAMNAFFLSYQNMFVLVAEANMEGQGWTPKHLAQYGSVYFVASMITMLVAIPYWISIGMFS